LALVGEAGATSAAREKWSFQQSQLLFAGRRRTCRHATKGGSTNLTAALLTIAFLLLTVLLVTEFAARWWFRVQNKYWLWKPYCREEFGLVSEAYPKCPSPVRFIVNSDGERGYEVPRNVPRLYRVLVAGGSAVESYILDQEASWPIVLQRNLERPENLKKLGASHVHVGNMGKSGVGAELLDFILQRVLRRMGRFDAIMIMVGASDILHWIHEGGPPRPFRPLTADTNMDDVFGWHPLGPFKLRLRQMALTEVVRRVHRLVFRPVWRHKDIGGSLLRARRMRENAEEVRPTIPHPEIAVDNFEIYLRKVVKTAQAKTDRVILVQQPYLAQPPQGEEQRWHHLIHGAAGNVFQKEVKVFYATEVVCKLQQLIDERTERVAEELGIECCDLRALIEPTFDSYYDLYHFTPVGAAAAAEILAKVVLCEPCSVAPAGSSSLSQSAASW
jgi:lysophospholipase L1-like esterase